VTDQQVRFSDGELIELRQEFRDHVSRFDKHEEREERQDQRWESRLVLVEEAVTRNTEAMTDLTEATAGVVQAHNDAMATLRFLNGVQKVVAVTGGAIAAITGAVWAVVHWLGGKG
jgi:hypothetical protein